MKKPPKIITLDQVVAKEVFDTEFAALKKALETQESRNWQSIIGVVVAFIFAVGVIVVDAMLSRHDSRQEYGAMTNQINTHETKINNLGNRVDNIFVRNSYLRQ